MTRTLRFFLKRLIATFYRFGKKRVKLVKLVLAIALVIYMSGVLLELTSVQLGSNYPANERALTKIVHNQAKLIYSANSTGSKIEEPILDDNTDSNGITITTIGVGVYWNAGATSKVTSVDWGTVAAGSQKNSFIYIRNEGNAPITISLSTLDWTPSAASNYLALTWNYDGQTIGEGVIIPVTLILTVSPYIAGINAFNFNIGVQAMG
jgi:hypothetical protein